MCRTYERKSLKPNWTNLGAKEDMNKWKEYHASEYCKVVDSWKVYYKFNVILLLKLQLELYSKKLTYEHDSSWMEEYR